jgi:hypothetical protein
MIFYSFYDSINGFDFLFEICELIDCGHIPPLVSRPLVASQLLVLEKQAKGV